jgi:hypothetical protein
MTTIMEIHTRPDDFTAAELSQMAAEQARTARWLRAAGEPSAEVWERWAEQTRRQARRARLARRAGLAPLSDDEWDGD